VTVARPASTTARPHDPEQGHGLLYALELVVAALLGNEESGHLACTRAVTATEPGSASA
jgi:hypothetical protein